MSLKIENRTITDRQLRAVLELVCSMTEDPDMQMSVLNRALLVGAKTLGIPKAIIIRELEKAWDSTRPLATGAILKADAFTGLRPVGRD